MNEIRKNIEQLMCEACCAALGKETIDKQYCEHRKHFCYDKAKKLYESIEEKIENIHKSYQVDIESPQEELQKERNDTLYIDYVK